MKLALVVVALSVVVATSTTAYAQGAPAPAAGAPAPPPEPTPAASPPADVAMALPPPAPVVASPPRGPVVSVSWSPVHLVLPVVEIEGELSPAPHVGVGVILGAGKVSNADDTVTATAIEGGAQFNYYFMRNFSGLHGGVEVIYLHASDVPQDATVSAAGISAGPYAGYKVLTDFGFTFIAQLGVQMLYVSASNTVDMKSETKFGPLLNLNLGWSF
jgi:hypothetical protein